MKNKQLVFRALEYLSENADNVIAEYRHFNEANYHSGVSEEKLIEVDIDGEILLFLSDAEFTAIEKKPSKKELGNLRTKQVIKIALTVLRDRCEEYSAAATEALSEIDELVKHFPALDDWRGWEVYGPDAEDGHFSWIDKVFYGNTVNSASVRQSLIGHDNYDPSIVVR